MKKMALALVAALSLGVMAGCGSSGGTAAGPTLNVTAGDNGALAYNPSTLTAKKGEKVTVHFVNNDPVQAHTFVIKDLNVKTKAPVAAGKSEDLTFTPANTGSFEYHCDVAGHETMKGTITVN